MANLPLSSWQVPNDENVYVVTDTEAREDIATLQASKADASEVETALAQKADKDAMCPDLVAGNLISTQPIADSVPYVSRVSKGIRVEDEIVGGTVVWNQLVREYGVSTATISETGDVLTVTPTGNANRFILRTTSGDNYSDVIANHVYLSMVTVKSDGTHKVQWQNYLIPSSAKGTTESGWTEIALIIKPTADIRGVLQIYSTSNTEYQVKKNSYMLIDLTAWFNPTIADYVYSLEQATAGAGVALAKKWAGIKGYIPHDAGTLKSVSGVSAHKMVGFNQLVTQPFYTSSGSFSFANATRVLPNIPYQYTFKVSGATSWRICFKLWDMEGNDITDISAVSFDIGGFYYSGGMFLEGSNAQHDAVVFTFKSDCYVQFAYGYGNVSASTVASEGCLHISDPQRNGKYEPYKTWSYLLDSSLTLRGITKLVENQLVYDGDIYKADGSVQRRYGIVDLGTLTWTYSSSAFNLRSSTNIGAKSPTGSTIQPNAKCSAYVVLDYTSVSTTDKSITIIFESSSAKGQVWVHDSSYTDAASFKAAMSGVYLVYELETPTTESAEPYTALQTVYDGGTEEYVTDSIPVGHNSLYYPDMAGFLSQIPVAPTTNGTYTLKVVVSGGVPTYSWVSG